MAGYLDYLVDCVVLQGASRERVDKERRIDQAASGARGANKCFGGA